MKNWFRIVAILFVIFLGVGLLVALKSFSIPTVTTGEFIIISGTNSLIIGGVILLSLTLLSTAHVAEVEKKKPAEEAQEQYLERALKYGLYNIPPEGAEGKFAWNIGAVANNLRKQEVKNLTVYGAFASAVSKVAQELRGYLKKKGLDNYILDRLSEKTPEAISYLFDKFSKLYGQMSYVSKKLGTNYNLNSVPKAQLKKFAYSLR